MHDLVLNKRILTIISILKKVYPEVSCVLVHENAFQLLAATILSAQCTDVQVNKVTPILFKQYATPREMAEAPIGNLEKIIRSTGFYHNKAKHLKMMANKLILEFGGNVPDQMEELLVLPGVARKTANVVLGDWFKTARGIVVDTHVKRLSRLLGLTAYEQPLKIEQDLMALLPEKEWIGFSHRLILLGRQICIARRPRCVRCPVATHCPSAVISN